MTRIVALVTATDRAGSPGPADAARAAIAELVTDSIVDEVLFLPDDRAATVQRAVATEPEATTFLVLAAGPDDPATVARQLLAPLSGGEADLAIGLRPATGPEHRHGLLRRATDAGLERACGWRPSAALSPHWAVAAARLRGLDAESTEAPPLALLVEAARTAGPDRIREVPLADTPALRPANAAGTPARGPASHRPGAGWFRRASDLCRALWSRVTTRRTRILAIVATGLLLITAMLWSSGQVEPSSRPGNAPVKRVVVIGVPSLGLEDLAQGRLPNLSRLAAQGAVGAANVQTLSDTPSSGEGYASLGAGVRLKTSAAADDAHNADEPLEGGTAAQVLARRTGQPTRGEVAVTGGPQAVRAVARDTGGTLGALGEALNGAGRHVAVVGSGDSTDPTGQPVIRRPAAIAVMNGGSSVDYGDVRGTSSSPTSPNGQALLMPDSAAPFGLRADPAAVEAQVQRVLHHTTVVIIDPGDTERASQYRVGIPASLGEAARRAALTHTDELIAAVAKGLPKGTLLMVVGITPPTRDWQLTPLITYGAGVVPGELYSPSTHRVGHVLLTDIAPTILDALQVAQPVGMTGAPLRYHAGPSPAQSLAGANARAFVREPSFLSIVTWFIVIQVLFYLGMTVALWQGWLSRSARALRGTRFGVLTFAAWPLATFVFRALPAGLQTAASAFPLVWILAGLIALAAGRLRSTSLRALELICGLTVALLVLDLATGSRLQVSSILGYSQFSTGRYVGIGNSAFAVLASCATIAGLLHVHHAPVARRREAVVAAAMLFCLAVVADGWPSTGVDLGGVLTMVPVFAMSIYVVSGHRVRLKTLGWTGLVTLLVIGALVGVDVVRSPDQRTHQGRFAIDVFTQHSTLWSTVSRKWTSNLNSFTTSVWILFIPLIAIALLYVLVVAKGWEGLLPRGSGVRAAAVAALSVGVIGWLTNDSGLVVTALVIVYVLALLAAASLDQLVGTPEIERIPSGTLVPRTEGEQIPTVG